MRVSLSKDTISRRFEDLSSNLKDQVCEHFEAPDDEVALLWSLQVDDFTDISGKVQLLAFIRFIKNDKCVSEYLFCRDVQTMIKVEDIFRGKRRHFVLHTTVEKLCQCLHRWLPFHAGK